MKTERIEILTLNLTFGCTAKGKCDRMFVCINPNELLSFNSVCPYLVASDMFKQSLQKSGIKVAEEGR